MWRKTPEKSTPEKSINPSALQFLNLNQNLLILLTGDTHLNNLTSALSVLPSMSAIVISMKWTSSSASAKQRKERLNTRTICTILYYFFGRLVASSSVDIISTVTEAQSGGICDNHSRGSVPAITAHDAILNDILAIDPPLVFSSPQSDQLR
ncbi:MAG: hypothetical protein ACR5LF_06880 [Symbiopectobacterium sp.]